MAPPKTPSKLENRSDYVFRHYVFPSILVSLCPPSMLTLVHLIVDLKGDVFALVNEVVRVGLLKTLRNVWEPMMVAVAVLFVYGLVCSVALHSAKTRTALVETAVMIAAVTGAAFYNYNDQIMPILNIVSHSTDPTTYRMLFGYAVFEILLLKLVPGPDFLGPVTPTHNRPKYKDNGIACFFITLMAFAAFSTPSSPLYFFPASIVYDNFKEMIGACNVLSFTLCILLNIKGRYAPTNSDAITEQTYIMSFYWGIELHPEVLSVNVKQFTNCRFGMIGWAVIIISFAAAQYNQYNHVSDAMLVNVGLQLIYITKFFHWENGYFATMDMQEDRAGFYICWGCICWLPCLYTSSTLCLATQGRFIGQTATWAIIAAGVVNIGLNYWADYQRKVVRETDAKCTIWGSAPKIIRAKYRTADNVEHSSILLASGFWGVSRHSHYLFELMAAFFWSLPSTLSWIHNPGGAFIVPMAYFIFLTILLIDRSMRDDKRCYEKYGTYWDQYRALVPYKILPGLF